MNPSFKVFILYIISLIIIGCITFCIGYYIGHFISKHLFDQRPKLKNYKIVTNGKVFKAKKTDLFSGYMRDKEFTKLDHVRTYINEWYMEDLKKWEDKHNKWSNISTEKDLKRYLKKHPEKMDIVI